MDEEEMSFKEFTLFFIAPAIPLAVVMQVFHPVHWSIFPFYLGSGFIQWVMTTICVLLAAGKATWNEESSLRENVRENAPIFFLLIICAYILPVTFGYFGEPHQVPLAAFVYTAVICLVYRIGHDVIKAIKTNE